MAVNEPIPRAQPEGEVCLRSHNNIMYYTKSNDSQLRGPWNVLHWPYCTCTAMTGNHVDDNVHKQSDSQ